MIAAVALLAVTVCVILVMFSFGWRLTYAPELKVSWEAVSATAAWLGTIGTVAAIFSAIYVAYRQNKITLFENRYNSAIDIIFRCIVHY